MSARTSESWRSENQNTMGGALDRQFPVCASLGRLYDPLRQLAKRVRRTLAVKEKMVWTDASGYVFATPLGLPKSMAPHAIVGVYWKETLLREIEVALRLALRERARRWIVDWNEELQIAGVDHTMKIDRCREVRSMDTESNWLALSRDCIRSDSSHMTARRIKPLRSDPSP
jgi:hypothetical protein